MTDPVASPGEVVDPRDAASVAEAVRAWAAERFGIPMTLAEPARSVGTRFDSYIHLVRLAGPDLPTAWRAPLVVRIVPTADRADRARREAAIQDWCASQGFTAPAVMAVADPGELLHLPVMVMERVPGRTLLDALKGRPWRFGRLVDGLADLQLRLHALPTAGWPADDGPTALADARLGMVRSIVPRLDDPVLQRALERAEAVVPRLAGTEVVPCHGDFHPLNVLVDGDRLTLIDWTDAALGPREGDVARTLLLYELAAIAAGSRLERVALGWLGPRLARRHRRRYEASARLDPRLITGWQALHALHGWAQVVALHAGAFDGASSSAGQEARVPIEVAAWLQDRFEASLAGV